MTFRKIMVPIDFSAGSEHAMRFAIRIAERSQAELVLAHAWHLAPVAATEEMTFPGPVVQQLIDDEARGLDKAVETAKRLGAKRVSSRFLTGLPSDQLVTALEEDPSFDLVVMSTHGRSGLKRVLLGSVAEKVVRHAPCPVLTTREGQDPAPFVNVLCPVDFSASAQHAIELASQLIEPGGKGITLLHVLDLPVPFSGEPALAEFTRDLDVVAARQLEGLATELRAKVSVPVITRTRIGSPGAQILRTLDEDPTIDLVTVGSHGRTGIKRALLGSVAEKTVRHAACPVLVARTRTAE